MPRKFSSVRRLTEAVESDPNLAQAIAQNPAVELARLAALDSDVWIYRVAVVGLALVLLTAIGSAVAFHFYDKTIPDFIIAVGSGALGGITGLLTPAAAR